MNGDQIIKQSVLDLVDSARSAIEAGKFSTAKTLFAATAELMSNLKDDSDTGKMFLADYGEKKISVIKVLSAFFPIGLVQAKELAESAPVCLSDSDQLSPFDHDSLDETKMRALTRELRAAGATVEFR